MVRHGDQGLEEGCVIGAEWTLQQLLVLRPCGLNRCLIEVQLECRVDRYGKVPDFGCRGANSDCPRGVRQLRLQPGLQRRPLRSKVLCRGARAIRKAEGVLDPAHVRQVSCDRRLQLRQGRCLGPGHCTHQRRLVDAGGPGVVDLSQDGIHVLRARRVALLLGQCLGQTARRARLRFRLHVKQLWHLSWQIHLLALAQST
mmetsp:Transcript_90632/g.252056  ORF Transcript_90632/g.252056 Transcript_90632/m.252056 type:complete len:200 (-) Transcript_90632:494-1093(-)